MSGSSFLGVVQHPRCSTTESEYVEIKQHKPQAGWLGWNSSGPTPWQITSAGQERPQGSLVYQEVPGVSLYGL
jgi:hypothetical protein